MDKPHKKLNVWKESIALVGLIYELAKNFPKNEEYGLTNQIKRAAISIPANVAEGAARQTKKEFIQFLHIAKGSLSEVDTHLEIANHLGYIVNESSIKANQKMVAIDKMLTGLINSLKGN